MSDLRRGWQDAANILDAKTELYIHRVRLIAFRIDDRVDLYDFDRDDSPVHSLALKGPAESVVAHPSDLGIAYADRVELVRLDRNGTMTGRVRLNALAGSEYGGHVSCAFSHDGSQVWVFSPDAMLGRGVDRILVIDDATGDLVAEHHTGTLAHGASFTAHPDGSMFVSIGEGQDGVYILRCRLGDGTIQVHDYGWHDRVFVDLSPDGETFMTGDHQTCDNATFHRSANGSATCHLHLDSLLALSAHRDEPQVEWAGGFLDAKTAVVVLSGCDTDTDEFWHEHYLVCPTTGAVHGRWPVDVPDAYAVELLGDGTWLRRHHTRLERVVYQQIVNVAFHGAGSGVDELSWGQRELWGGMIRQQTWMPMGMVLPLPDGTTLDEVVAELRFVMERFPSMRTRLRLRADEPPQQVLSASGELAMELVDVPDGADPGTVAQEVSQRLHETAFDFEKDWPVRQALIRHRGALTHQVTVVCHLVNDGFGGMLLVDELTRWRRAGQRLDTEPAGMPPLEQARWQRSPAGRRQSAAALRHYEKVLRAISSRRFPGPLDPRRPRHWQAGFTSRALHLAARVIAERTGADRTTVLLAAFAFGLAAATGIHPVVVRVVVSNRFRRALAETVSPVSQPALCVLDVVDLPFDQAVARTGQQALTAYKHAYYDPNDLDALLQQVSRERGEEVDIACYFNDRKPPSPDSAEPVPSADEVRAALSETVFHWMSKQDRPNERLFLTLSENPDMVQLDICGDTEHIPPAALETCVRTMEAVTVAAATA